MARERQIQVAAQPDKGVPTQNIRKRGFWERAAVLTVGYIFIPLGMVISTGQSYETATGLGLNPALQASLVLWIGLMVARGIRNYHFEQNHHRLEEAARIVDEGRIRKQISLKNLLKWAFAASMAALMSYAVYTTVMNFATMAGAATRAIPILAGIGTGIMGLRAFFGALNSSDRLLSNTWKALTSGQYWINLFQALKKKSLSWHVGNGLALSTAGLWGYLLATAIPVTAPLAITAGVVFAVFNYADIQQSLCDTFSHGWARIKWSLGFNPDAKNTGHAEEWIQASTWSRTWRQGVSLIVAGAVLAGFVLASGPIGLAMGIPLALATYNLNQGLLRKGYISSEVKRREKAVLKGAGTQEESPYPSVRHIDRVIGSWSDLRADPSLPEEVRRDIEDRRNNAVVFSSSRRGSNHEDNLQRDDDGHGLSVKTNPYQINWL